MNNKIKTQKIFKHYLNSDDEHDEYLDENAVLSSLIEYDINGNKILEISFDNEGELVEKYEFSYNDKNQLVSKILYFDEKNIAEKVFYSFNENNVIIKEEHLYTESDSTEFVHYFYDNEGKLTSKKSVDEDDECEWEVFFEYDNDKLISETRKEYEKTFYERKIKYDEAGNISEIYEVQSDDFPVKHVFEYDEKGNEIKKLTYNHKNKLIGKILCEYNEQNKLIAFEEEDTSKHHSNIIEYDEKGNLILHEEKDMGGNIIQRIIREYDANNQNTQSKIFMKNKQGYETHYILKYQYYFYEPVNA